MRPAGRGLDAAARLYWASQMFGIFTDGRQDPPPAKRLQPPVTRFAAMIWGQTCSISEARLYFMSHLKFLLYFSLFFRSRLVLTWTGGWGICVVTWGRNLKKMSHCVKLQALPPIKKQNKTPKSTGIFPKKDSHGLSNLDSYFPNTSPTAVTDPCIIWPLPNIFLQINSFLIIVLNRSPT